LPRSTAAATIRVVPKSMPTFTDEQLRSEAMPYREPSRVPEKRTALDFYCYSRLKFSFLRKRQRTDFASSRLQDSELWSAILLNLPRFNCPLITCRQDDKFFCDSCPENATSASAVWPNSLKKG